ncbi:MAG: hypothetical protein ACPHXR_07275 [Flavicella sp.]
MQANKIGLFILQVCLVMCSVNSLAQTLGQHDANIQWQMLDSEKVRVLFPAGTEIAAKRMADVINHIHNVSAATLGDKFQKIDLVVQNQQSQSNGFVTLAPFRTEFYGLAPQNQQSLGTGAWLDLLSIHEYRHVLQYTNGKRGLSKFMHWISGQNGWAAAINFSFPDWYFEGDAVLSETLLSNAGRGRTASFFKELRALVLESKTYSYDKAQNGSFKDLVPNHYKLGYIMNSYLRNNYGPEINKQIIADAGSYSHLFYPFSTAVKKQTGNTTRTLYKESFKALQKEWLQKLDSSKVSKSKLLTRNYDKKIQHYQFPHYLPNGSVLSLKKSLDETPSLHLISDAQESKIKDLEITSEEYLSATKNISTWTRFTKDWRRGNKNYSDIVTYNLETKQRKKITNQKRYFSPNISPDLSKVAAIHYDENIAYSLHILDLATGNILYEYNETDHPFLSTPKWSLDGKKIIYLAKKQQRIAFFELNLNTKQKRRLSPWTHKSIGQFCLSDTHIYFSADFDGIDNIYSIALSKTHSIEKITHDKIGAYMPQIDRKAKKIVYSVFTSKGYRLHEISLDEIAPLPFSIHHNSNEHLPEIKTTKTEKNLLDSVPKNNYEIKPYNRFFRGLKLHSWGWVVDPTNQNNLGAQLQFKNILGEVSSNVSFVNNSNEKRNSLSADFSYGKYFIVPSIRFYNQERNSINTLNSIPVNLQFSENTVAVGLEVPLSQVKGNYIQNLSISTNLSQHFTSNYTSNYDGNLNFKTLSTQITASNLRRTAIQNIYPRFGQFMTLEFAKSLKKNTAEKIDISSVFYFPGLVKNHSLNSQISWHKELLENPYQFPDTFQYARGYNRFYSNENITIATNYEFPIAYPDFGFFGICYFKRIRGRLFADKGIIKSYTIEIPSEIDLETTADFDIETFVKPKTFQQNSVGGSLLIDLIFCNKIPLTLGLRNSYLIDATADKNVFQLFFNIAL